MRRQIYILPSSLTYVESQIKPVSVSMSAQLQLVLVRICRVNA